MKTYVKPQLVYEDFMLNQTFAGTCSAIMNVGEENCNATPKPETGLTMTPFAVDAICELGGYCYTNQTPAGVFTS